MSELELLEQFSKVKIAETLDYYNVSNRTKKNQVVPIGSNSLNIPSDNLESYKNVK